MNRASVISLALLMLRIPFASCLRPTTSRKALTAIAALASLALAPVPEALAAEQYFYLSHWGSAGSAPGSFSFPYGLAVDKSNNVYVADAGNNRIQRFTSAGVLLDHWGSAGNGSGQFDFPQGVAVDTLDDVYVADTNNHRIQKFSDSGTYLTAWGQRGSADGYLAYPTGVAANHLGQVFVAEPLVFSDSSNHRIQKFSNTGTFITKWNTPSGPQDVAVDSAGNVFVIDGNSVVKYTPFGAQLARWGSSGTGPGQFDLPAGLGVDKRGDVYVADTGNHRIQKFTGAGTFVTQWGSFGTGQNQFRFPADVAVDDSGNVYVSDQINQRIQKFGKRPTVLIVHGICDDEATWQAFGAELVGRGFDVHWFDYGLTEYSAPPTTFVPALLDTLKGLKTSSVAVVAHSMGGVITRDAMLRQHEGTGSTNIQQLVTIGTPHHGSDLAAWLDRRRRAIIGSCGIPFGLPVCIAVLGTVQNFGCIGDYRSRIAISDLSPGSPLLNTLNYGSTGSLYEPRSSRGWGQHQPETNLIPGSYHASIGGTRTLCYFLDVPVWGLGPWYRSNDGVVANASALFANAATFRSLDGQLPIDSALTHTSVPGLCGPPYHGSSQLAEAVGSILETSPESPPVARPEWQQFMTGENPPEDSLGITPIFVDTVGPGQIATVSRHIPPTTVLEVTLVSEHAVLSLVKPDATVITPDDTSAAGGNIYFGQPETSLQGFRIEAPHTGTWTFRVDATGAAASQHYGCVVAYATPVDVRIGPRTEVIAPGDSLRVRASVSDAGSLRTDVTWACGVIGPDSTGFALQLFDDGAHGDSLSGDGIYGGVQAVGTTLGLYDIVASAALPGGAVFMADGVFKLDDFRDLAVSSDDIWFSRNLFNEGDTVVVFAEIHNNGSEAVTDVAVEVLDASNGVGLLATLVDIGAGGSTVVEAPWIVTSPVSHRIEARVSTSALVSEVSYANNRATREIVLGEPVGVTPGAPPQEGLWFAAPSPNPTMGTVTFNFRLPRHGFAVLEVFDMLGRRIREWSYDGLPAGMHTVSWDGRGEHGERLAAGVLVCRLRTQWGMVRQKLVLRR